MTHSTLPTIALVGRTNVGKSTLFNRLLERPKALVSDIAGTTRDRNEGECLWRGNIIRVIDTGGLDVDRSDEIERDIERQAQRAIEQADVILFVVDLKDDPLPQDRELALRLAQSRKPVLVVGNKAETPAERASVEDPIWHFPGLEKPIPISSVRGSGVGDLLDLIFERFKDQGKRPREHRHVDAVRVAVIGKPNVGKSTLLNAIAGEERFITSPIAHTTREPNDTLVEFDNRSYVFIDTAGMRKKSKVKRAGGLEAAAVRRNERVIKAADVTLLVVDASEPVGTQEKTLAGLLKGSGSGVIIVVNKWDLVEDKTIHTMKDYRKYLEASFPFIKWAPVLFVSALTKQRVRNLFDLIDDVQKHRTITLTPNQLGAFLKEAITTYSPKRGKGPVPPKVLGLKQRSTSPPIFDLTIKSKRTDTIATAYIRYLENRLRDTFKLTGTPLRVYVKLASAVSD